MPHQCLSCGHLFAEGSSAILQGCPDCKGTRFFYTATPVSDDERRAIATKAQKDLRQVVTDLLQKAAPETAKELGQADDGQWATLKASDVRRIIRQAQHEQARLEREGPQRVWENPDVRPVSAAPDAQTVRARLEAAKEQAARAAKPDTVNVRAPGAYDIDVKGLMDKAPIVVHKDGAYLIHLGSLFDQGRKGG
ncbi:MAG TPA: Zn-ribbon containing protein [Candidatus Thermoplasmatota archaeon]|nr:Zn-ribbon containing protein [Candidatus Thermoplasmatota archaeon]